MLRIGNLPPAPCEEDWLQRRIEEAARAAGRGEFWVAADVARGMMDYLSGHYNGSSISLSALLEKVRNLLARIDCSDVADHLDATPPPTRLSLPQLAVEAGNGFELHFFEQLGRRIAACAAHGVREIHLSGIKSCVRHLRGAAKWRKDCEALESEILAFIRSHHVAPSVVAP